MNFLSLSLSLSGFDSNIVPSFVLYSTINNIDCIKMQKKIPHQTEPLQMNLIGFSCRRFAYMLWSTMHGMIRFQVEMIKTTLLRAASDR